MVVLWCLLVWGWLCEELFLGVVLVVLLAAGVGVESCRFVVFGEHFLYYFGANGFDFIPVEGISDFSCDLFCFVPVFDGGDYLFREELSEAAAVAVVLCLGVVGRDFCDVFVHFLYPSAFALVAHL